MNLDLQAQIAEKKKKVEEIRKLKLNQSLTQNDPLLKQVAEMKKQEEEKQKQSPEKQTTENLDKLQEPRREQPVNMLQLYLEQKRRKLGLCSVDIYTNQPKIKDDEITTFEFGIQCELQLVNTDIKNLNLQNNETEEALPQSNQQRRISMKRKPDLQQSVEKQDKSVVGIKDEVKNVSTEEINSIIKSQKFNNFFDRTSKIIEKALYTNSVDVLESLMTQDQIQQENEMRDILSHQLNFYDSTYSYNRVVTAMQWSPSLPETFLTAYSQNEEGNINDQVGVVLIWSLQLKTRPEFYCFCQSPVMSSVFHPFSPSIVLGGLYNGQLVLWDLRSKQTPEKRTTLSSGGHSYPIYNLAIIGSQNAHNVVSVSNDGRLCLWNLAMLNQPQKVVDLKYKSKQGASEIVNQEINVMSMAFPKDDANNFYVGAENGTIYQSQLHPNQAQAEGQYQTFEDHNAHITGISLNSPTQQISPQFQNLMLSSSFDWTAKLWNPRLPNNQCIMTFESSEDYIYDVAWNGNHPTLFSTIDGEGYIDLWDISLDVEAPIKRQKTGNYSLNKQIWSQDGQRLAVGDSHGTVQIFSLDKRALKVDMDKIQNLETTIRSHK